MLSVTVKKKKKCIRKSLSEVRYGHGVRVGGLGLGLG